MWVMRLFERFFPKKQGENKKIASRDIYVLTSDQEKPSLKVVMTVGLLRAVYTSISKGIVYLVKDLEDHSVLETDIIIGNLERYGGCNVIQSDDVEKNALHQMMLHWISIRERMVFFPVLYLVEEYLPERSKAGDDHPLTRMEAAEFLDAITIAENKWNAFIDEDGEAVFTLR